MEVYEEQTLRDSREVYLVSIGSFTLIKNEAAWIAAHLTAWLPILDRMVFFDGKSGDGTLEIIKAFQKDYSHGNKIILVENKDPLNLEGDYVRLFNECLNALDTDLAFFLHPDMIPSKVPKDFKHLDGAVAASVKMRSFAGNPDGPLFEILGRGEVWKSIYRLRNPDLGAHYHGHYGAHNEDVYFREITGDDHTHHGQNLHIYPYEVVGSGIEILHYSDVRTPRRRYERMVKCLVNQGHPMTRAEAIAMQHPRVTLKDSPDFTFSPSSYPSECVSAREKYRHLEKELALV